MLKKVIPLLVLLSPAYLLADETLTINDHQFQVKLAVTDEEHTRGLMHIKTLNNNQGMLFVYPSPKLFSFWMKDTLIPLDILFFDQDGRLLEIKKELPPCEHAPCKKYSNQLPAQYVLELSAGTSDKRQIKLGDSFEISTR